MFNAIHRKLAPLARLMLALVLLQTLFVAHEAVALEIDDVHHVEATLAEPAHGGHADETAGDCDNCCHCQGHGSHLALLVEPLLLIPATPAGTQLVDSSGLVTSRITSIDRPPII